MKIRNDILRGAYTKRDNSSASFPPVRKPLDVRATLGACTRRPGARASEAHALCLAGDVAAAGGAEDAPGYYREALALASELGMRPLVAHCHLGLGKLYARTDKREQAQEHIGTAATMYREMDMRFWRDVHESSIVCTSE